MYAFQYETKASSSISSVVLYWKSSPTGKARCWASGSTRCCRPTSCRPRWSPATTTPRGAAPSTTCLPAGLPAKDLPPRRLQRCRRCAGGSAGPRGTRCRTQAEQCPPPRKDGGRLRQEELQAAACEAVVDFVYKAKLEAVEAAGSSPYLYYHMQLQAVIKSGTDPALPLRVKKFVTQATCYDSLGLREQGSYVIVGQTSDLWRVKSGWWETRCPRDSG
ncbi:complement C3 isoform X2 [Ictidomys tridecemlineatus]